MAVMVHSVALGKLIHEKNQKSKIKLFKIEVKAKHTGYLLRKIEARENDSVWKRQLLNKI
jgi:hypothetical protein